MLLSLQVPKPRTTKTSQKAATPPASPPPAVPIQLSKDIKDLPPVRRLIICLHILADCTLVIVLTSVFQDHQYALDPVQVKKKLAEAQERIEELQRELRNSKDRERRLKKTVMFLITELKSKNNLPQDLQPYLDIFAGWLSFIAFTACVMI